MTILLILALGLFTLLAVSHRQRALQALVVLLPTYLIRFSVAGIPLTFFECMILILSFVVLVQEARHVSLRSILAHVKRHLIFYALATVFLIAATIGVVVADDARAAWGIWKAYFIEPFVVVVLCAYLIRTSQQFRSLMHALIGSGVLVACYGLLQWMFPAWIPAPWNTDELFRITSFYPFPNAVGLFLGPIVAFAIGQWWFDASSRKHGILGVAILLMLLALVLSESQGAWTGVIAAVIVMSMFHPKRWWFLTAWIVIAVVIVLVPLTRDYLIPILTLTDVSGEVRRVLWTGSWRLIQDHWLWGVGLSGFPLAYDLYREARHVELLQYPHNIVLNFWVEMGILGVISAVGLLSHGVQTLLRSPKTPTNIAMLGMITASVVHGIVDVPFFKNDLSVLWWIMLFGAIIAPRFQKTK